MSGLPIQVVIGSRWRWLSPPFRVKTDYDKTTSRRLAVTHKGCRNKDSKDFLDTASVTRSRMVICQADPQLQGRFAAKPPEATASRHSEKSTIPCASTDKQHPRPSPVGLGHAHSQRSAKMILADHLTSPADMADNKPSKTMPQTDRCSRHRSPPRAGGAPVRRTITAANPKEETEVVGRNRSPRLPSSATKPPTENNK